ncbi:trypsin-like serine protease [Terrilactibacillus sp. S3-3]|nr:trypsin-like serine protease [Terrilactibacillus sp. S3-3]
MTSQMGNTVSCTGSFIDRNTVLTAVHCVYDSYYHKYYQMWAVYPAENGYDLPYGGESTTTAYTPAGFINSTAPKPGYLSGEQIPYDFAVINLATSTSFPNQLPLAFTSSVNDSIDSVGYPGDKSFKSPSGYYYYYMYKSSGKIVNKFSGIIEHNAYVTSGMSGGPVMNPNNRQINLLIVQLPMALI